MMRKNLKSIMATHIDCPVCQKITDFSGHPLKLNTIVKVHKRVCYDCYKLDKK